MSNMQFDPSKLADIHLPQSIGIWPLAPGWWILLGLFILLCVLIILFSKENKKINTGISPGHLKKLALKELSAIEQLYQSSDNAHESIKQLSIFLRRFALAHYHREQVASLTDEQWLNLLDEMSDHSHKKKPFSNKFSELITNIPYQANSAKLDTELVNQLFAATKRLVQKYKHGNNNSIKKQESKRV